MSRSRQAFFWRQELPRPGHPEPHGRLARLGVCALAIAWAAACEPRPSSVEAVRLTPSTVVAMPSATGAALEMPPTHVPTPLWLRAPTTAVPLATPSNRVEWVLQPWAEDDVLTLLEDLEKYAEENDFCEPAGCTRSRRRSSEEAIRLMLSDALYRYPEATSWKTWRWRLAVADAATEHADSDVWIVHQIDEYLQGPGHTLATLAVWLSERGFTLDEPITAPDLFGDEQPASLLHVQTSLGLAQDGLFLAWVNRQPGTPHLTLLRSTWNFDHGDSGWQDVADHNGNGRLEAMLLDGARSGSMADATWLIYEWQDDHFQELTGGAVRTLEGEAPHWVNSTGPDGPDQLEVVHLIPESMVDAFVWDGTGYVPTLVPQPLQALRAYRHQLALDPGQRIDLARRALMDWADLSPVDRRLFGPAYPDYLHFQTAFGLSLSGHVEESRAEFEALRTGPVTQEDGSTYPNALRDAAQAFLMGFRRPEDVYRVCADSKLVLDTALDRAQGVAGLDRKRAFEESVGVSSEIMSTDVCGLAELMPHVLEWAGAARVWDDPVTTLQAFGVDVVDVQRVRLDADTRDDVLWIVREPALTGLATTGTVWCLLSADPSHTVLQLATVAIPESAPREPNVEVTAWDLPDHVGRGFFLSLPQSTVGYIVRSDTIPSLRTLFWFDTVVQVILDPSGRVLDLERTSTTDPGSRLRYRWDASIPTYRAVDITSEWVAGEVDPTDAIPPLHDEAIRLRDVTEPWRLAEAARIAYLSALVQERLGNTEAAARGYRDLWQRYPGTVYALVARARLVPTSAK